MRLLQLQLIRFVSLTLLPRPQKCHLPRAKCWISTFGTEPLWDSDIYNSGANLPPIANFQLASFSDTISIALSLPSLSSDSHAADVFVWLIVKDQGLSPHDNFFCSMPTSYLNRDFRPRLGTSDLNIFTLRKRVGVLWYTGIT